MLGRGSAGPDLSLARLLGWSAPRSGSPVARGCAGLGSPGRAQADTTPPSRLGPAGRSSWAAVGHALASGPSRPGRDQVHVPSLCRWTLLGLCLSSRCRASGSTSLPALIRNRQVSVGVGVGLRDRLVWRVAVLATCLTLLCVSARSLQRSH
jgi:hypothetical protein